MDASKLLRSTAEAAFATGAENRIVMWNEGAEKLLGYKAAEVLGRPCHEVLCGVDVFGNRYCDAGCTLHRMASRRESVRRFEMDVRKAAGDYVRVSISILASDESDQAEPTIIHMLQPASDLTQIGKRAPAESPPASAHHGPLTRREVEVLRRLAAGEETGKIASTRFSSVATVRTHIRNILRKLGVHSKLAAVSAAAKKRLI